MQIELLHFDSQFSNISADKCRALQKRSVKAKRFLQTKAVGGKFYNFLLLLFDNGILRRHRL